MTNTGERNKAADRALVARSGEALAAIHAHAGGRRGIVGVICCPFCQTPLGYWVATNGHVRACCETPGCVRFIQ